MVTSYIRTKIRFAILRSTLIALRGTRGKGKTMYDNIKMGNISLNIIPNSKTYKVPLTQCLNSKQKLTDEFFQKEHTKPLFTKHSILALRNLYTYHTFMEVFKILKLRTPPSLLDYFTRSLRKETTLITAFPTHDFISRSTKIWNTFAPKLKLIDYAHKISAAKSSLKSMLLKNQ